MHVRALQFAAKSRDRFLPDHRIERRQVDQVIGVNHQRPEVETLTRCRSRLDIVSGRAASAPHPRTGGKDLKGVRPELGRLQRRPFERARSGCMDSQPQSFIVAKLFCLYRFGAFR